MASLTFVYLTHTKCSNASFIMTPMSRWQQLYMAAGENETEGSSMGSPVGGSLSLAEPVACAGSSAPLLCSDAILREGQQSEQLCVVCHFFPLSRALLPCRHTCICAVCFCEYQHSLSILDSNFKAVEPTFSHEFTIPWLSYFWVKFMTNSSYCWWRFPLVRRVWSKRSGVEFLKRTAKCFFRCFESSRMESKYFHITKLLLHLHSHISCEFFVQTLIRVKILLICLL